MLYAFYHYTSLIMTIKDVFPHYTFDFILSYFHYYSQKNIIFTRCCSFNPMEFLSMPSLEVCIVFYQVCPTLMPTNNSLPKKIFLLRFQSTRNFMVITILPNSILFLSMTKAASKGGFCVIMVCLFYNRSRFCRHSAYFCSKKRASSYSPY